MPTVDSTYANRIKRLRCRTLAIFHVKSVTAAATSGFYAPEQGPGGQGVDDSVRSARALGGAAEIVLNNGGVVDGLVARVIAPCCLLPEDGGEPPAPPTPG